MREREIRGGELAEDKRGSWAGREGGRGWLWEKDEQKVGEERRKRRSITKVNSTSY